MTVSGWGSSQEEFSEGHKFIYFAVVEGLYDDGLSESSLAAIIGEDYTDNFVIGCPICSPTYDALMLYKSRPTFARRKIPSDNFGEGLKVEERKALVGEPNERRKQVRKLVSRWVEARFAMMNLPDDEEKKLRAELKEMSDKGTESLEKMQNDKDSSLSEIYADWEFCPSCGGATMLRE